MKLTNGGQKTANGGTVLVTAELVLAENVSTNALDDTRLGITLVVKLTQAEGESTELLLDLGEDLARCRALQAVGLSGTAVESGTLVKGLALARSQADAHLNTPDLTNLGGTVTLGTFGGRQDNLLGALNLVALEQPRGRALDNVAVIGLGDLLDDGGDLGLGRGLLGGSLGLLFLSTLGQKTGRNHQAEENLVGVVGGENQIGGAASDGSILLVLGGSQDGVANNGTETINLSTKLDLDGLSGLDFLVGLGLVGGQGGVGSDIGGGRDGGGVRETYKKAVLVILVGWVA